MLTHYLLPLLLLGFFNLHASCDFTLLTSLALSLSLASTVTAVSDHPATSSPDSLQDLASRAPPTYINGPVISSNFPDPSAIYVDGTWYAFGTNDHFQDGPKGQNIQIATSTDFVHWTLTGKDALPTIGKWAYKTAIWAPNVIRRVCCLYREVQGSLTTVR